MRAYQVRAILEGRMTQTRRIVKPKQIAYMDEYQGFREMDNAKVCPYGQDGDRLWVRETWGDVTSAFQSHENDDPEVIAFRADEGVYSAHSMKRLEKMSDSGIVAPKWKPSISLPRRFSRITLEIAGVRVERLQEISEEDARAEGCERMWPMGNGYYGGSNEAENPSPMHTFRGGFRYLWDHINSKRAPWESNPWVWVVEFKRLQDETI